MNGPIRVGDTVEVCEGDYLNGVGSLTLRICELRAAGCGPGIVVVCCVDISDDGHECGERAVLVRYAGMLRVDR